MGQRYPNHEPNANWSTQSYDVTVCTDCVMEAAGYDREDTEHEICREWEGYELVSESADPHFSWSECEGCHSPLGGDRYDAEMIFIEAQLSESVIHSASQAQIDRRS